MRIRDALLFVALVRTIGDVQGAGLTFDEAMAQAGANLDVSIARRALDAARADVLAADHAPLPQLSLEASSIDLQNGVGGGDWAGRKRVDKKIGLDWTVERGGKRGLRTEGAQSAVAAGREDLRETRTQQMMAAAAAFYDLLGSQERTALVEAIAQTARDLWSASSRRARAGDLSQQDEIRTRIEAERAQADVTASQLDRSRAQLALAQLMGRPHDAPTLTAEGGWPDPRAEGVPEADALKLEVERRADVAAASARVAAARSAVDLARAQRRSDVTVGGSLEHFPGTSTREVTLRLQMPLAWGYAYEGEIGRAQAQLDQAEDLLLKTRQAALAELLRLRAEAQGTGARLAQQEEEILPRAQSVADKAEFAFRRGALSLSDLLDARRTLRATLLDALAARVDMAKALAALRLRRGQIGASSSP